MTSKFPSESPSSPGSKPRRPSESVAPRRKKEVKKSIAEQGGASKKTSNGLSELSKQLRILQAQNQAQTVEIERLERQLRIAAELQGISVADLRAALGEACAGEIHAELQSQIQSLKAQLEVAHASSQPTSVSQDSLQHKMATAELRIGELEEVEESLRCEVRDLYRQWGEEKEASARLQILAVEQLRRSRTSQNESDNLPEVKELTAIVVAENQSPREEPSYKNYQLIEHPASVQKRVEDDRVKLLEQQLAAEQKQHELRQAQFKARGVVANERVRDLEQQLASLYLAFGLVDEEHRSDQDKRDRLQSSLDEADAQVARQASILERDAAEAGQRQSQQAKPLRSTPPPQPQDEPMGARSLSMALSPTQSPQLAKESIPRAVMVIDDFLLIKSGTLIKTWKRRRATLTRFSGQQHVICIDNGRRHVLQLEVSRLMLYPKYQHGFLIDVDPRNDQEPMLCAAAENDFEFHRWITALNAAIGRRVHSTSSQQVLPNGETSVLEKESLDLELALKLSEQEK